MKHYVLVSVHGEPSAAGWSGFDHKTANMKPLSEGAKKLSDSVWLLDRENDIAQLGRVCKIARLPNTNLRLLLRFDRRGFGS